MIDMCKNMPDDHFAEEIDGKKTQQGLNGMDNPCPEENLLLFNREKGKKMSPKSMPDISRARHLRNIEIINSKQMIPHIVRETQERMGKKYGSQSDKQQEVEKSIFFVLKR
jgi:hypothetical protein